MEKMLHNASIFIIGVVVGSLTVPALSAQVRVNKQTTLMTTDLTGWCDGKEVIVTLSEYGPGTTEKHYHPGHSFGYVIEGSQISTQEGKPPITVRTGDVLYEEPMRVNISANSSPAKVVTFRILEKGKPATIRVP